MLKSNQLLVVFLMLLSFFAKASESAQNNTDTEEKGFDVTSMIMHHIADAHEFHLFGEGAESVSIPLPIILYSFEKGFITFMSSEFEHGHAQPHGFAMGGHGISDAQGHHAMTVVDLFSSDSHASFIDLSITKNVFSMMLSIIILMFVFLSVAGAYKKRGVNQAPSGLQNLMETLITMVRDEIAVPNIGEKNYRKYMPYLLTVFFFIWLNNILGLIPFFPGSANLTGNIAFTLVLALGTLIMTNVVASTKDYWAHILWMPGVPWPVKLILAPIELVGILTKPFALTIRLFANISAGHIIILSLVSLIFILKTVWVSPASIALILFIDLLEILVAFLQAFVFTMLSALFIGAAAQEHEHEGEHAH